MHNSLHRGAIKRLLSKNSVADIFERTKMYPQSEVGNLDFANYQRRRLEALYPGFHYDFFVMSSITLDEQGFPTVVSAPLDLPSTLLNTYFPVANNDDLSQTAYENPGRAIAYTQIRSHNAWIKSRFFKEHCLVNGIYRATCIVFLNPAHRNTYMSFDYLGAVDNDSWSHFDFTKLELSSFPFALAFLYRTGKIDEAEFQFRLFGLEGLTEAQLSNLRKYINSPHQSLMQQSEYLGISEAALKESLYQTRAKVSKRNKAECSGFEVPATGSLRPLEAYYGYLTMLGDHTKPLNIIRL